jgi:hypothetical protein
MTMRNPITLIPALALLGATTAAPAETITVPGTPIVGDEVIFSSDPLAASPRVTALADGTFVLAWETAAGDLVARHLDKTGSFTTGNFLQGVSTFEQRPLTTPLVVQESSGAIMTVFGILASPTNEDIGLHTVDANFTDTSFPYLIPKVSSANEGLVDAVPTFQGIAVSYEQLDGNGRFHTFLRWYGPDGTPSPTDQQLGNPGEPGSQLNAKLLASGTDLVYAVYAHVDPATGDSDVRLQDLTPNGINGNAIGVSGAGNHANFPDIAKFADGTFIIVWQDNQGVVVKHMLFNGIVLEAARISDATGAFLPKVAALKDGSFILAWTASSGTEADGSPNEDIFLRRFVIVPQSPGSSTNIIASIGSRVHLVEPGDQGLFQMSMTTLADGRVVLAYASETGDATNLNNLVYRIIDPPNPTLIGPTLTSTAITVGR